MEALYRSRDWFASLPSAIVLAAVILFSAQTIVPPRKELVLPPISISLTSLPELASPLPTPPEPAPREPVKAVEPRTQPTPPRPVSAPVAATPSSSESSIPAAPAAPARSAEPVPASPNPAPEAPPATPPAPRPANLENGFIAKVRAYLESVKRYPTGREVSALRPRGKTRVWFVLTRGGESTDAGVEDSSGSILLDNAALATVRRGRFPPFPDDAWPGRPSFRFTAELDFVPAE